jgi:hypothetical protein
VVEKGETLYQNPLKDIVYGKSKKDVKMTVAKGEILQENGKIYKISVFFVIYSIIFLFMFTKPSHKRYIICS